MRLHPPESRRRQLAALAVALIAISLLGLHTAVSVRDIDYSELGAYRRLWSDQAAAVNDYLDRRAGPVPPSSAGNAAEVYRAILVERTARGDLRPWQFWRTMGPRPFLRDRARDAAGEYDDPGRALLLASGFRVLGGIAPWLILWLGCLLCAPVIAWMLLESFAAGHGRAGSVFALGLACSAYFVETLALPRYAVGFYLAALPALVALGVFALRGAVTARGLLLRALAAGLWLALCALCRSSVLFMLPAFASALAVGLWRARFPRRRAAVVAAALLAALAGPYVVLRQPEHHGLWSALWEGLGDFDREKGHAWSDADAERVSREGGGGPLWTAASEAVFRRLVLRDVAGDPLWYGVILLKRTAVTVTQWKLWPWRARDGTPVRPRTSWNEGFMDKYYGYTTTADHLRLGRWRVELPIVLLLLPGPLLVGLALWPRGGGSPRAARDGLALTGIVALATLPLPVLVSTAAAQETQAFALVYFLALAFASEDLSLRARPPGS